MDRAEKGRGQQRVSDKGYKGDAVSKSSTAEEQLQDSTLEGLGSVAAASAALAEVAA